MLPMCAVVSFDILLNSRARLRCNLDNRCNNSRNNLFKVHYSLHIELESVSD